VLLLCFYISFAYSSSPTNFHVTQCQNVLQPYKIEIDIKVITLTSESRIKFVSNSSEVEIIAAVAALTNLS
jgi:hypothetical protein